MKKNNLLRAALYTLAFLLWLAVSVVLGGFALSIKDSLGLNIFTATGRHAFQYCLMREAEKAISEELAPAPEPATPTSR